MINNFNANKKANYMSKDISREKDKLRLLWKEKRKKLSLNFSNEAESENQLSNW